MRMTNRDTNVTANYALMESFHLAYIRMAKDFDYLVHSNEGLFGNFCVSICIATICIALFVVGTLSHLSLSNTSCYVYN